MENNRENELIRELEKNGIKPNELLEFYNSNLILSAICSLSAIVIYTLGLIVYFKNGNETMLFVDFFISLIFLCYQYKFSKWCVDIKHKRVSTFKEWFRDIKTINERKWNEEKIK